MLMILTQNCQKHLPFVVLLMVSLAQRNVIPKTMAVSSGKMKVINLFGVDIQVIII